MDAEGSAGLGPAPCGPGDLEQTAGAGQPPGEQRGAPGVEIGLAREPRVERLKAFRGPEEQRRCVATAVQGVRGLGSEQVHPGARELVQRASLRRGQQPESRIERTGLQARFRGRQRAVRAPRRIGASARPTRCRNAAAALNPPRACARPADRSSSEATSSSGRTAPPRRDATHDDRGRPSGRSPPPAPDALRGARVSGADR